MACSETNAPQNDIWCCNVPKLSKQDHLLLLILYYYCCYHKLLMSYLLHDRLCGFKLPWLVDQIRQLLLQGVQPGWIIWSLSRAVRHGLLPGPQQRPEGLIAVVHWRLE